MSGSQGGEQKQSGHQNMQTGSGLTRYRSAPSSYFTSLLSSPTDGGDGFGDDDFAQLFNPRASSPETQQIFSRFMNSSATCYAPPPPKHEPDHVPQPGDSDENLQNEAWSSVQIKVEGGGGGTSGLIRHSSSPAGLINIGRQVDLSEMMAPISEIGNEHRGDDDIPDYINSLMSDNFLSNSDDQGKEGRKRPATMLFHHLSLPAKMSGGEVSMQDSVPCKIRAKRGCATHPRSIAERVRRTKISERIRKLQELVPNMEKQTNTSDMLDLAVDYIRDLQRQVKTLSDNREKCSCPAKQMML